VKRYIILFDVWDKRLDEIVRMIGKARKEGKHWGGEVTKKEMRRLVISGNHYLRKDNYVSRLKIMGVAKLWQDETGEKGIVDLFIEPLPSAFQ
jgi:hypothetical protein